MARKGQGYPCYQHDMMMMMMTFTLNGFGLVWFGLVWFNGISTIVGHLMPNPFYTFIKCMISKHILKIIFLKKIVHVF